MTVEELLQELVDLCREGKGQWEVRYAASAREDTYAVDSVDLYTNEQQVVIE